MYLIKNDTIALVPYTPDDAADFYRCWKDIDTQKGYNYKFDDSLSEFSKIAIDRFKFWVTMRDIKTNEKVGVLRLSPDEIDPDLAVWIFPEYRNMGYGKNGMLLALNYIFENFSFEAITAGCFERNKYSKKILEQIGYRHEANSDTIERDCFTGEKIKMLMYRITKEDFLKVKR